MQDAQNLAEFMYLSYSQKLWEDGVRVPYFKQLGAQHKAAWLASAQTAITFTSTHKVVDSDFIQQINKQVILFP